MNDISATCSNPSAAAEQAARSYRRLLDLADHPLLYASVDAEGAVLIEDLNAPAARWLGVDRAGFAARALQGLVPQDWVTDCLDQLRRAWREDCELDWSAPAGADGRAGARTHLLPLAAVAGQPRQLAWLIKLAPADGGDHTNGSALPSNLPGVFDNQNECIKLVDAASRVLHMNAAGLRMLGVSDVDSVNRAGFISFVHPADRQLVREFHQTVIAGKQGALTFRLLGGDGRLRHVDSIAVPSMDPATGAMRHLAITRDATALVEAAAELSRSRSRLDFVLRAAGIGHWTLNLDTWEATRSAEHDRCFGYETPCAEWNQSIFLQHLHPDDRPRAERAVAMAATGDDELDEEYRVIWPDGSLHWIWARAAAERDCDGRVVGLAGIVVDITARKQAELQAQIDEQRWRFAVEGSGDGTWDWDIVNNTVAFSRRWSEILGYREDEVTSSPLEWEKRLHPDDRDTVLAQVQQHLDGRESSYAASYRLLCADGRWKWVLGRGLVVARDNEGRPLRMIGTNTDIDRLVQDAERIEHLRERLALAIKGSGFGVWEFDLNSNELLWDQRMYEIYGHTVESFGNSAEHWRECLHPDDRDIVDRRFQDLVDGRSVELFEFRMIRASDGAERHIEANGYLQRTVNGQPQRLVGMNRDITERWQAEQQVRLLGASMSRLSDLVLIHEAASGHRPGRMVYANDALFTKTGYAGENAERDLLQRADVDGDAARLLASARAIRQPTRGEVHALTANGDDLWLDLDVLPIFGQNGQVAYWVVVGHDITARKIDERAIRELNRDLEQRVAERSAQLLASNQDLRTFTYSVSHDLRAPLRGIEAWSQALQEDCRHLLDDAGRNYLDRVCREAHRMNALVDALQRLARIGQSELTLAEVDLKALTDSIIARLRDEHHATPVAVTVTIEPDLQLLGDEPLLYLAILNLLDNAWKFTSSSDSPQISVVAERRGDNPVVRVSDNGVGFDMGNAAAMFEPFYRMHGSQFPGTGIGLAIVDRIMRRHGGSIEARGAVGIGATFELIFPSMAVQ